MMLNSVIRGGFPVGCSDSQRLLVSGDGIYLRDQDGRQYLDLSSGLWNMPLGYSDSLLKSRISAQLERLPFSNLLAFVSDIQNQYAERLTSLLGDFSCVLYTCSGSEAVEAAIKTCRKYQVLKGRHRRKKIGAFSLSYHGTSYGAMSVSGIDQELAQDYAPLLADIRWLAVPASFEEEALWISGIDRFFDEFGEELAGFLAEPVIASGGVIPIPTTALQHLQKKCREQDILLIMDEVATGFGRTGTLFAFQKAGIAPDLVCLSKAINNGFLPLGVLAYARTCAEFLAQSGAAIEHFSTQGGNNAAVAAAMGMLDRMEDYDSFRVREKGTKFLKLLRESLGERASIRGCGLMLAIELPERFDGGDLMDLMERFRKRGLIVYLYNNAPFNRGISLFPPFVISDEEIESSVQRILSVLHRVL